MVNNYVVLARKYRPCRLSDLIGQDVFVKTISNAILTNRIHHAFLFTGTRGVGKTSSARIIALSLNCKGKDCNGSETIDPCMECDSCKAILSGSHPDVHEFDAASNTGVDAIREVIEQCNFGPMMSRYKIYIIDEVHMLSKSAFNALLKTLEEPLSYVKFIFATTEVQKIPITISSRCQKFYLRNIEQSIIEDHLEKICELENIKIDLESLKLLAKYADGSVRDGLSLLDQVISNLNGNIIFNDVKNILNISDKILILELFYNFYLGKIKESLNIIDNFINSDSDIQILMSDLLDIIVDGMRFVSDNNTDIEIALIEKFRFLNEINVLNMPRLIRIWQIISNSLGEMKLISVKNFLTSLIFKLCYSSSLPTPIEILKTLDNENLKIAMENFPSGSIIK